jgi:iron complex outermembrane receptor protein
MKELTRTDDRLSSQSRLAMKAGFIAMTAALGATTAWSQTEAEDSGGRLEEVTITAEFRSTNLQETPIAITAVNAEMLEQRSQTSIFELTAQAPNVQLAPQGQANGSGIIAFIRGVGQTDFNFALEPGVGIYIDDVYYPTLTGSLVDLLDLERVEVLRGPQGTLAGRNSIGGAIKLFSQKPRGDGTGSLSLTTGNFGRLDVRAVADFSLIDDKLYARASGVSKNRDGYVDRVDYACTHPNSGLVPLNVGTGCKLGTLGGQAYTAGRLSMRWLASDRVEVNIIGDLTNDNSEAGADVLRHANIGDGSSAPPPTGDAISSWLIAQDDGNPATPIVQYDCRFVPYGPDSCDPNGRNPYLSYASFMDPGVITNPGSPMPFKPAFVPAIQTLDQYGASAMVDWSISDISSIKSITAWRRYDSSWAQDVDGSPLASQQLLQTLKHWQWSQELRFNGSLPAAKLDYTVGAFYFEQGGTLEARVDLNYAHIDFIHGPDTTPSKSQAAFVHGTFHLTDAMNVSTGVRYSKDEKEYQYFRRNPDGSIPQCVFPFGPGGPFGTIQPTNCALFGLYGLQDSFEGDRVDWRVALDYRWTDDFMTYGQVSTGYKGGGVNPRPFLPTQLKAFDPETLLTYELGFKSDLFGNRMRFNTSVFYNDYKDIILTLNACPGPPCAQPNNVGEAEVKGIEFETEIHPTDQFLIDSSLSYLDFEYTKTDPATGVTAAMITPYTPEWKASIGLQYSFPLSGGSELTARVDGAYTAQVYGNAINAASNRIPAYTIGNARLTWRAADEKWVAALEVTNITDELYYYSVFDQALSSGTTSFGPGMPRAWAVTLKHNFK